MTQLQAEVAAAADRTGTHSTAPALLIQVQAALGELCRLADEATEGGRRPYRVPPGWASALGEIARRLYLLGDQTGVEIEDEVRRIVAAAARHFAASTEPLEDGRSWI